MDFFSKGSGWLFSQRAGQAVLRFLKRDTMLFFLPWENSLLLVSPCKNSRTWTPIKNILRFHMLAEIMGFSIPMNVFHRDWLVFLQIWRWSPLHVSQMWYDGRRCVAFQEPPQWCTITARCSGRSGSTKSAWNLGGNVQGPICYHTSLKIDTELFYCVLNYLGITSSWNNFYFCWTCYLQSNEWRFSFVWT